MTTYASNKDGNSIVVDAQEWEELQALVKRQRIALEKLLTALENAFFDYGGGERDLESIFDELQDLANQISSASTMTGASEK